MHSLWLDLFLRSTIILCAALALQLLPGRWAPVQRHRIVLAAFAMLLIWPVFSAVIPQIQLPVANQLDRRAVVTVEQTLVAYGNRAPAPLRFNWPLLLWIAGAFVSLAPLVIGYMRVRHIACAAVPAGPVWRPLLVELCRELELKKTPELLTISRSITPFTFGLRRPRILLPIEAAAWSDVRRRAVLLHELAHIQRRDVAAQLFACFVTALWWFQPLCWISRWALRRESERACDALVLASGLRPSDYATALLEIARVSTAPRCCSSAGIPMARGRDFEGRLAAILAPQTKATGRNLLFAAISVLTVLTITASAVTVLPQPQLFPGASPMKRTLFASLLASATLSAATIGGSLFDPSGVAVANAKASLYNPDTAATQDTTTTPDGKFTFENLPAGQYILHIEKPGFPSLFHEFNVSADATVERGLFLNSPPASPGGSANQNETAAHPLPSQPGEIRVGGRIAESNLITKVQPVYPQSAKVAGIQGTVSMDVVISAEGVPQEIAVLSSPGDDLTQSALDAVRQWRYRPTLLNGQPVPIITNVIVNYTLAR